MKRELITCDRCGTEISGLPHYQIFTRSMNQWCEQAIFEGFDLCGACHSSLHQEWTEMRQP